MRIFRTIQNDDGSYSAIHDNAFSVPAGWIKVSDSVELTCGGFGTPTIENGIMTAWAGDETAWAAWQAAHPETSEPDSITQTQIALAELAETESAHDLENKLALAELAETLMGGTTNG